MGVERDGRVRLPAAATSRVRHLQELRRLVTRRLHGWQRRGHVGQGHFVREEGGGWRRRQEEVRADRISNLPGMSDFGMYSFDFLVGFERPPARCMMNQAQIDNKL